MGKQVQVKPGYVSVWLYSNGVFDAGEIAVLTDAEWTRLGIHQFTVIPLGDVPDPTPDPGPGSLTVQEENVDVASGVVRMDFQGAGVTATTGAGEVIVNIPGALAAVTEVYDQDSPPTADHPYLRIQRDGAGDVERVYFGTGA